ncbi:MAG: 4Fe-4S binding protein [Bacteroidales bacterium]|nr:4Fe-4S binding protein [Bacteroidales bacterium]
MYKKVGKSIINTTLLLLFFMAAVSYNGKYFGKKTEELFTKKEKEETIAPPSAKQLADVDILDVDLQKESVGIWSAVDNNKKIKIINTQAFSKGVYGYAGEVPMYLILDSNNNITNILLQKNNETPRFVRAVKKKGILKQWIGINSDQFSSIKPDALTGATMTSNAINRSVIKSLAAVESSNKQEKWIDLINFKSIIAILVILSGIFISFFHVKNKKLRTLQLILNTLVLGVWCGKFISIKILLGWIENGMNLLTSGVVFLMLILAIIIPLVLNKKAYYCTWICPFGSAQELAGKLNKRKLKIGDKAMRVLKHSRKFITLGLFFSLWIGVAADIVDYEPFSAFIFKHASLAVILIACLSIVGSVFTPRPWCRFFCPTGEILKWTDKM